MIRQALGGRFLLHGQISGNIGEGVECGAVDVAGSSIGFGDDHRGAVRTGLVMEPSHAHMRHTQHDSDIQRPHFPGMTLP